MWLHVAAHLAMRGINTVLTGGAVVAIHTTGAYTSGDLDLVILGETTSRVRDAMAELGFEPRSGAFVHPDSPHLFVEFVPGPLGIGREDKVQLEVREVAGVQISILSATDCVMDRMASYIHFQSEDCLSQAALVAKSKTIDWERVERFCRGESPSGRDAFRALRDECLGR